MKQFRHYSVEGLFALANLNKGIVSLDSGVMYTIKYSCMFLAFYLEYSQPRNEKKLHPIWLYFDFPNHGI